MLGRPKEREGAWNTSESSLRKLQVCSLFSLISMILSYEMHLGATRSSAETGARVMDVNGEGMNVSIGLANAPRRDRVKNALFAGHRNRKLTPPPILKQCTMRMVNMKEQAHPCPSHCQQRNQICRTSLNTSPNTRTCMGHSILLNISRMSVFPHNQLSCNTISQWCRPMHTRMLVWVGCRCQWRCRRTRWRALHTTL